jgi:hypothetical protein
MTDHFIVVGKLERLNSGKTVKIFTFNNNGRRCLIGQVPLQSLRELLNGYCLKADLSKYQNTNSGETSNAIA